MFRKIPFVFVVLLAIAALAAILMAGASPADAQEQGVDHPSVRVEMPYEVEVGQDVRVVVVIENATYYQQEFDTQVWTGGPQWGRGFSPGSMSSGTSVYWAECGYEMSRDACVHWWGGTVPTRQMARFEFTLNTSMAPGSSSLVVVTASFRGHPTIRLTYNLTTHSALPS